jgi:hypothetical protein
MYRDLDSIGGFYVISFRAASKRKYMYAYVCSVIPRLSAVFLCVLKSYLIVGLYSE